MISYVTLWLELKFDRRAVTALEYSLIGAVIIGVIFVGFNLLANSASNKFNTVGGKL